MGLDPEQKFGLVRNQLYQGKKAQMPIPSGIYTINEVLTKFVDLTGPLSKKLVKELASKCKNKEQEEE